MNYPLRLAYFIWVTFATVVVIDTSVGWVDVLAVGGWLLCMAVGGIADGEQDR